MSWWTCVDIETTGTEPNLTAMIQLSAVKFNVETAQIDHNFFNRCLFMPARRYWEESTRSWWMQRRETLDGIFQRMEDPAVVMRDFVEWSNTGVVAPVFMSKPLSFDFPFVASYCTEFGLTMPYPFWQARDMRSFIGGLYHGRKPFDEKALPFEGEEHNAIFDVLHQIKVVLTAIKEAREPVDDRPTIDILAAK